jgi:DNA-binding IclR family transcriptional regulator
MIKVLTKTFAILEAIVQASPQPVSLDKLSKELDLNKATCSRIIGDLVAVGYIVQISRQEGYAAGARAFAFSRHVSYKDGLLKEAEPVIKACAAEVGESVLMAEMHNLQRYILCHYNYNPAMNININQLSYNDLYDTATGIILLAYAFEQEVDAVVEKYSLPSAPLWQPVKTRSDLNEFLSDIRKKASFIYDGPRSNNLAIAAFPIFSNDCFIASVGVSVPREKFNGEHKKMIISKVKSAAKKISRAISHIGFIG